MFIKIIILLTQNEKVLLIKEYSNKKNGYFWNLVKGTFEPGIDKNIKECALREAREEVKADVTLQNIIDITVKHEDDTKIYISFLATSKGEKYSLANAQEQQSRSEDIKEIKWFTNEEFEGIKSDELMSPLVTKVFEKWKNSKFLPLETIEEL